MTDRTQPTGWEAISSGRRTPAYVAEAVDFQVCADELRTKRADELEALTGPDNPKYESAHKRLAAAQRVCEIANRNVAAAYARWNLELALTLDTPIEIRVLQTSDVA
jgi:hypothetical protein